jgi:hypothetical protein
MDREVNIDQCVLYLYRRKEVTCVLLATIEVRDLLEQMEEVLEGAGGVDASSAGDAHPRERFRTVRDFHSAPNHWFRISAPVPGSVGREENEAAETA